MFTKNNRIEDIEHNIKVLSMEVRNLSTRVRQMECNHEHPWKKAYDTEMMEYSLRCTSCNAVMSNLGYQKAECLEAKHNAAYYQKRAKECDAGGKDSHGK